MEHFFNFHTHLLPETPEEKSIYNLLNREIDNLEFDERQWISVGIHPWYADAENWETQLLKIEKLAVLPQVKAIGECGLDKLIDLPLEIQLLIFEAQVKLAERLQKPVIIHCVKAFNELIRWKKQRKVNVPLIVHGFNNKPQIAQQLLSHGLYLSLGTALLTLNSNASKVLKEMPLERLFLENDNDNITVSIVYDIAGQITGKTSLELRKQLWQNFVGISGYTHF